MSTTSSSSDRKSDQGCFDGVNRVVLLPTKYGRLIEMLEKEGSYSPYSEFCMGAVLRAAGGTLIRGADVGNASYGGSSLHA